jgi:hypothetical protein
MGSSFLRARRARAFWTNRQITSPKQDWSKASTTRYGILVARVAANGTKNTAAPIEKTFATAIFFYPAATNYKKPEVKTHFSFNVLYGHVGGLDGLELGLLGYAVNGAMDRSSMGSARKLVAVSGSTRQRRVLVSLPSPKMLPKHKHLSHTGSMSN